MLNEAYRPQCAQMQAHCTDPQQLRRRTLILLTLALGTFSIGTSEFASMGILQLFAESLHLDISTATHAIEAYAFGVVLGGPAVTILAAKLNRKALLLALMSIFVLGNVLSAFATGLAMFTLARFVSGIPQGAYFGAAAVVASYIVGPGQGGRAFAMVMTGLTVATRLNRPAVWGMVVVAALGVASIFAVYTFIGMFVTDGAALPAAWTPVALGLFGVGMTVGNVMGGRMADRHPSRGLVTGFASALAALAVLAAGGDKVWILMTGLFAVGATMMVAIPTIQVRLTQAAPDAPTLMGAMNLAALNVANAIGAWAGGQSIARGHGLYSAVWVGFGLTLVGLAVFLALQRKPVGASSVVARLP